MPLEYGFDRIIEMCDEQIAETLGEAGDDGILGMSLGYYYMATKEITKGLSQWADNDGKRELHIWQDWKLILRRRRIMKRSQL